MNITETLAEISATCSRQGYDIIRDIDYIMSKMSESLYLDMKDNKEENREYLLTSPQVCICNLIIDQVKSDKKLKTDLEFASHYEFSSFFISRLRHNRVDNISDVNLLKLAVIYPRIVNEDKQSAAQLARHLAWRLNCNLNKSYVSIINEAFSYKVMKNNVYNDDKRAQYVYDQVKKELKHDRE